MPAAIWYGNSVQNFFDGTETLDWDTNTIKVSLHTSTYTPDRDADDYHDDATNEVANGNGYTTGGQAITTPTVSFDSATDETRLDADDPAWPASSFTARTAVWYKDKGGASSADPLIGYLPFGSDVTVSSGTLTIACDATGHFKLDAT
jgi:hypothetical protein